MEHSQNDPGDYFQCTITHGTFVKQYLDAFQIVPHLRGHRKKHNSDQV